MATSSTESEPSRPDTIIAADQPAAMQMYGLLRRRIIAADLLPGTRLSEQEIADQYDLSRQPVREAFIRLAGEGLIEVRPQRGTYVSRIDMDWVMGTRFIRESVEADIVRLAARLAQPQQIVALREILERQEAIAQGDAKALVTLDEEFHYSLAAIAGQTLVWRHLQGLKMHLDRVRHLVSAVSPKDVMLDQHRAVVDAIAAGDSDRAEKAMRLHLRRVFGDLPAIMQLSPQYFDKAEMLSSRMHYDPAVNA
ncbi:MULTISPECIES: GntR family transcriptional regulator [Paracoccus]|uniref:FCD domain-containing protein n=1 Tax=Paracoccus litorisediminis TaxID=2006130 RepID=A0A844HLR7_9RHOB|nr:MULTISPECIES: GntR family transcriptional regulator [Paracoccus]MBD9528161.1 GntR family transcriptional regulator [Paracoccus sp. PAR01]MTH59135.1 FCD domain-containing protein [Paracoccus litorisediminis]